MVYSRISGLLMDWGSKKLNNIILPTSGKISVLTVNSFGCYVYVNISVEVNRGNIILYIIIIYIIPKYLYFLNKMNKCYRFLQAILVNWIICSKR